MRAVSLVLFAWTLVASKVHDCIPSSLFVVYKPLVFREREFTVLNIGGVRIGSFQTKIIEALASIRASGSTCCKGRTLKLTNP